MKMARRRIDAQKEREKEDMHQRDLEEKRHKINREIKVNFDIKREAKQKNETKQGKIM